MKESTGLPNPGIQARQLHSNPGHFAHIAVYCKREQSLWSNLGFKDISSLRKGGVLALHRPTQSCACLTSQWLSSLVREMSMFWCCSFSSSKRACQRFSSSRELFSEVFNSLVWACSSSYSPFSWWCRKLILGVGEPQAKGLRAKTLDTKGHHGLCVFQESLRDEEEEPMCSPQTLCTEGSI